MTLTDDTLEYVESRLSALNFYETFDKDITSAVISIVTTTFISAICSSISLMGVFVSVVPLFVYECTGLNWSGQFWQGYNIHLVEDMLYEREVYR